MGSETCELAQKFPFCVCFRTDTDAWGSQSEADPHAAVSCRL